MTHDEKLIAFVREEFAGLFEVYANDQRAMISRYTTKREKREAEIRAIVYMSCVENLRDPNMVIHVSDMK